MIIINNVVLIGRVSKDIDLKFIPSSGIGVCKFSLAVDKGLYGDKKQQAISKGEPTADFINITVFGKSAENCASFLKKGSQAAIQGRISTGTYITQAGEKKYTFDVIAEKVEFIGSKAEPKGKPVQADFEDFPDEDIFTPADDSEIPF